jgi:hypothetical protein
MTAALAHAPADDLSPEMVELLTAAAQTTYGRICYPYQVRGREQVLAEMRARGLIWYDGATPMIRDAGRKAVGAPSERELICKNRGGVFAKPRETVTRRHSDDPRSRITYESYRSARMFCTLVVKLAEPDFGARGLKCSMNGDPLRWFTLPLKQIIIQPETKAPFVLAVVPKWLAKPFDPKRITELAAVIPDLYDSVEWTREQKDDWNRLRRKASIINTRIRSGGPRRTSDRQSGAMFA